MNADRTLSARERSTRPVVVLTLVICLAVAMAPWLSGGQEPVAMLVSSFALILGAALVWRQPVARILRRGPVWVFAGLLIVMGAVSLLWTANGYSTGLWLVQWGLAMLAFRLAYAISGFDKGGQMVLRAYLASAVS